MISAEDVSMEEGYYSKTERITKQPDGSYFWRCRIDYDYFKKGLMMGVWACVFITIFILGFGVILSVKEGDWEVFLPVLLAAVIFALICIIVFGGVMHIAKDPWEIYTMTDNFIKSGSGKSSVYFDFKNAREVFIGDKYIELKGKLKRFRFYFPPEDKALARGLVVRRIPLDAVVHYKEEEYN